MTFNIDLAQRVLAHTGANPNSFAMDLWTAGGGTVHCLGGWAIALSGIPIREEPDDAWPNEVFVEDIPPETLAEILRSMNPEAFLTHRLPDGTHKTIHAREVARILLGLTWQESEDLFYTNNAEARRRLAALIDRHSQKEEQCPTLI